MVTVHELTVSFGERTLFDKVSFFLGERDRVGLVGKNGAGKSTLMKIIAGKEVSSKGSIVIPKDREVGYLPQQMQHNDSATIIEEAGSAFDVIQGIEARIEAIGLELGQREDYESQEYLRLIQEMNDLNDRLNMMEGGQREEQVERVLKGLGFVQSDMERPMGEFSGGWKMRVELAKILLRRPDVLLLDEPTNHLDIESIEWLEGFLKDYPGAVMLISHDRDFLDNLTKRTIEISSGRIHDYKFPYSKYLVQRREELERQKAAAQNQQKYIEDTEKLINKFRAKKNKAAFAQTLIRKLDKLERIEVDDFDQSKIDIRFPPAPHSGKVVLRCEDLSKSYDGVEIFSGLNMSIPKGSKIALVGKNGVGKSTFLRLVNSEEEYSGELELGHQVKIGYFAQDEAERLDGSKTVFETIDETAIGDIRSQIRNILGSFLFSGDDVDKKVSVLSGGEKTRLAICKLLLESYNLLILDEPTNHLDLVSKNVLKKALKAYDGTLIIVSHDRNFLHELAKDIYELTVTGVKHFVGDIYDFLKEKRADSIAVFEQSKGPSQGRSVNQKQAKKEDTQAQRTKNKERQKLERRLAKLESQIERLESEKASQQKVLSELDYENHELAKKEMETFQRLQQTIEEQMEDWERLQSELEGFDAA